MLASIRKGQLIIKKNGFTLIEAILSAALFLIITTFVVPAFLYGEESMMLSGERQRATIYAEEGLEALRNLRDASFANLTAGGPYGLATTSNVWSLNGVSDTNGEFTRQIFIGNAGTDRLIATSTVTWNQNAQRTGSLSLVTFLNNWAKNIASDITIVGSASAPADNGSLAGPSVSITPPAGMQTGDVAVIIANYRASAIITMSTPGGQTWTALPQITNGTTNTSRVFYAVYTGNWVNNPRVTAGGTSGLTVVMHVLRNVDPTSVLDVAQTAGAFTAPAAPNDVAITGINTLTDGSLVLAIWATGDDNTWGLQTAGWANLGLAQYRNLQGNDSSLTTAYKIVSPAGPSGDVINRQLTLGGDAGTYHILAFKRKP